VSTTLLPALSGDVSSSAGSGSLTVTGLKGVALPTLATGYLYYDTSGGTWSFSTSATFTLVSLTYGGITSGALTTTTTASNQVVMTISDTTYRSGKFLVQTVSGSAYQFQEISFVHDGTNVYFTETTLLLSGTSLATFSLDITSGNVRLLVTPVNASTTIKSVVQLINV
jgi:hypothetical protein